MPTITTTSAPGKTLIFFKAGTLLNATNIIIEMIVTIIAPT